MTASLELQTIRRAEPGDVSAIVAVHLSAFPGFFLTFLGPNFLRLLYREFLRQPGNISLVACDSRGKVVGFAVGVRNQRDLYHRLAYRRWWLFAAASVRAVLRNPLIIPRLLRAFKYPARASSAACPALLLSVAVMPQVEGQRVGRSLLDHFLEEMTRMGIGIVSLVTDRDYNDHANRFYVRCGFSKACEFQTLEGRWMNEYVITLGVSEPGKILGVGQSAPKVAEPQQLGLL